MKVMAQPEREGPAIVRATGLPAHSVSNGHDQLS